MPTLRQILETLPHRDLRGIATRLNVRRRAEHRKEIWITAICSAWHDPARRTQFIASLSPAAQRAALRLAQSGNLPAALFLAEYGPVRRPGPGQHWSPPPWEQPATVSEELYYSGLLAPTDDVPLEKAGRVTLPADLAPLFKAMAEATPAVLPPANVAISPLSILLHDVAQALCFLAGAGAAGSLRLLHDRWLPPAALADLNRRLLRSQPVPPRSHARSRWPRFLFFLATAAGLQQSGRLTASGWTWLAEAPAARLIRLWDAWRSAPLSLRTAYRQPTAALPEPWPNLALKHLADLPAPFTAGELSAAVLGREPGYTAYFAAHLADLSDLDAATADLLATLVEDWGILTSVPAAVGPALQLTDLGRWLLAGAQGDPPVPLLPPAAAPVAQLQVAGDGHWEVHVPAWTPPVHQARLALYACHEALIASPLPPAVQEPEGSRAEEGGQPSAPTMITGRSAVGGRPSEGGQPSVPTRDRGGRAGADMPCHVYRLDADTVAAAAAQGYELPDLLVALAELGVRLTADQIAMLQDWHGRGRRLQITHLPLLRAADRETMAQVLAHPEVRAGLGDLLAPTVALIAIPPSELAQRLCAAGFFTRGQETACPGQSSEVTGQPGHGKPVDSAMQIRRPQPSIRNLQSAIFNPQSPAALWLAGRLYAALGELIPLPLPPPFADLAALLESLSPADRATVQAQWEALAGAWRGVLDGQTYAPPPQPTDPERWRPAIEAAIAAGRSLRIRYFTAGRNVLTERTVTPYWIEEHRGIPYLRADCHLAGRVRLFRLDRIVELGDW